jgi:hypothetical protein
MSPNPDLGAPTDHQSVAAQVSQFEAAGCEKLFREVPAASPVPPDLKARSGVQGPGGEGTISSPGTYFKMTVEDMKMTVEDMIVEDARK